MSKGLTISSKQIAEPGDLLQTANMFAAIARRMAKICKMKSLFPKGVEARKNCFELVNVQMPTIAAIAGRVQFRTGLAPFYHVTASYRNKQLNIEAPIFGGAPDFHNILHQVQYAPPALAQVGGDFVQADLPTCRNTLQAQLLRVPNAQKVRTEHNKTAKARGKHVLAPYPPFSMTNPETGAQYDSVKEAWNTRRLTCTECGYTDFMIRRGMFCLNQCHGKSAHINARSEPQPKLRDKPSVKKVDPQQQVLKRPASSASSSRGTSNR